MLLQNGVAVFLKNDVVIVGEIVDPEHDVTFVEEASRQMEANETSRSGNKNFHRSVSTAAPGRQSVTGLRRYSSGF